MQNIDAKIKQNKNIRKCDFYKNGECKNNKEGICQRYKSKDDNLSLRCSGFWSEAKINHFKYYAEMFSTGMKNKWKNLCYIDLFSGPGKCIIREELKEINGTCFEVIKLKDKFTHYFFIDKNSTCISDLKKRLKGYNNVRYYNNDCNVIVREVVEKIPKFSLGLAVIDPDSLQFCFRSYKQLSERKIDLIVNYPISSVERAVSSLLSKKLDSKVLDNFHPGWRDIVSKKTWGNSKEEGIRNLVKNYVSKIEKLGYYSSPSIVPFKNIKNSTMYFLLLFSKDKKGIEFWDKKTKSLKKKDPQRSFF